MTYYVGIRTNRPTHIIGSMGDGWEEPTVAICGEQNMKHNYLTHRELFGLELVDANEIYISKDELQMHREQLCEKCKNHPDLALLLLGDV